MALKLGHAQKCGSVKKPTSQSLTNYVTSKNSE